MSSRLRLISECLQTEANAAMAELKSLTEAPQAEANDFSGISMCLDCLEDRLKWLRMAALMGAEELAAAQKRERARELP